VKTFNLGWSKELGAAILEKRQQAGLYRIDACKDDAEAIKAAVNQGIDSHLEACFIPDRGDSYSLAANGRMICLVSPASLPVLVRRLLEAESEESENLASSICVTLELELI